MNTVKHHDLADGVITHTTYDDEGRRISSIVTDENNHLRETTRYNGQAQSTVKYAPPEYKLDILNWTDPNPKIGRYELAACIEAFPEREVNWPQIAGALGLRVRAAWHWPGDLRFGYDCDMEIRGEGIAERNRYVRTLEQGWQRRP